MSNTKRSQKTPHHFKLVLLGDASVGKSCLVVRFAKEEFYENQEPTIGGRVFFGCEYFFVVQVVAAHGAIM